LSDAPEYFDLYDEAGHALGRSKRREEVHRDGDWHRSAHVWIYTGDGQLLFQRRAPDKDTWPGRLDASVGGHYRAGEAGAVGIARELDEELGLAADPSELVPLGVRRVESLEPGIVDRELQDIYLLRRDLPLTAYRPDPVEIDGLALLDAAGATSLHEGALTSLNAAFLPCDAAAPQQRVITADDLIPNRGPYISAIARAVAALLSGHTPAPL
jgi:isopentenyldiphosphate isomerase